MSRKKLTILCLPITFIVACGLGHGVDLPQGNTEKTNENEIDSGEPPGLGSPTKGPGELASGGACGTDAKDNLGGVGGESPRNGCKPER